jgi:L-asparagine oxygenase
MTDNVAVGLRDRRRPAAPGDGWGELTAQNSSALTESSVRLRPGNRDTIAALARELHLDRVPALNHEVILQAQCVAGRLPGDLLRKLHAFRKWSNESGTLFIRGLPIDEDPPATPLTEDAVPVHQLPLTSAVQLLVMCLLGEPISYRDEKNGELIQSVHPVSGCEERQENTGSMYLEFHTEDGFHPYRPDFLSLLGIRQDHGRVARTASASITRALSLLSLDVVDVLRRPEFRIKLASSFGAGDRFAWPRPVLSGDFAAPEICVDMYATQPLTASADWAFGRLRRALESVAVDVALTPGDLLIVDNRTALHARTAFVPRYDGQDRWLRRMFAVTDFRRSQPARASHSHVCAPLSELDATDAG